MVYGYRFTKPNIQPSQVGGIDFAPGETVYLRDRNFLLDKLVDVGVLIRGEYSEGMPRSSIAVSSVSPDQIMGNVVDGRTQLELKFENFQKTQTQSSSSGEEISEHQAAIIERFKQEYPGVVIPEELLKNK